ncbi:MAG: hypothetical protein IKD25_05355 [Bacteroidaceae bacterium]|nr:hypothetical protein [Bacteroidaceae bacterium]
MKKFIFILFVLVSMSATAQNDVTKFLGILLSLDSIQVIERQTNTVE